MKPARRARNGFDSRYLVYLNNRAAGKGSVKTIDLCDQKTAPLTPKSFIYNRRSYSQAGRRGFEPHLPLHPFNNLHEIGLLQKPTFRGNGVDGRAEPIEKNRLEGLTSSVPRWTSYIKDAGLSLLTPSAGTNTSWVGKWVGDYSGASDLIAVINEWHQRS
jgi:hypothetical protein